MARGCSCAGSTCGCVVTGGEAIGVSGIGTAANPFVIALGDADVGPKLVFQDTSTVTWSVLGSGTTADPLIISATASP